MQAAKTEIYTSNRGLSLGSGLARCFESGRALHLVPYLYLVLTIPCVALLWLMIPPMQVPDEGRHFMRALQISEGQILPQINPALHTSGGWLPAAAVEFVRDRMNPEFYRREDYLRNIPDRFKALDRAAQHQPPPSQKEFGVFFGAAIYPPALYLPQAAGIRLARLFSNKVYIWFYFARIVNSLASIFLIFLALRIAPRHQLLLLIPALLPMSLYQISSISCDAGIIACSILFVALSIRFLYADGLALRLALTVCLLFLTLAKPVYLPFGLLLLAAYKRLGWTRAFSFFVLTIAISAGAYLGWAYLVRPELPMAGQDFPGHDPSAQLHTLLTNPLSFLAVIRNTIKGDGRRYLLDMIGSFGGSELPLPFWFYAAAISFLVLILFFILASLKRNHSPTFLCGLCSIISMAAAIFLAAYIMWTPVNSPYIPWIQGRYWIPLLAVIPFLFSPDGFRKKISKISLAILCSAFFIISLLTTVRIVRHYYFPQSGLLGKNIHELNAQFSAGTCPAFVQWDYTFGWFSLVEVGKTAVSSPYRVLVTNETGTILGVSDPTLAGAEFPFNLLSRSSRSKWLVHLWRPNRFGTLHFWLLNGKKICAFGPDLKIEPLFVPSA